MTEQEQRELFAKNLRYYLSSMNKRQVDLAAELGVSSATTSDWLSGKKIPRMGKISHIADWLGINVSDLLEPHDHNPDSADALRDRVFSRSPTLFKVLDKASDGELKQIEKIANAIIDETDN